MQLPVVNRAGVIAEVHDYCLWTDGTSTLWRIQVRWTSGGPLHYVPVVTARDRDLEAALDRVIDSFLEHHGSVPTLRPPKKTRGPYQPEPEPSVQELPGHNLTTEVQQVTLVQPHVTEPIVTAPVKEVEPPKPRRLDEFWTNKRR